MKATFLLGPMTMEVRSISVPKHPPGGALIKVLSTGLCGSDINRIRYTTSGEVRVLGHEISGEIVSIDPNVTDFQIGDRVSVGHVHIPCMHCEYCRHGAQAMCRQFKTITVEPGGYAEYVALTHDHLAHSVIRISAGVSSAAATFIDPLGCCMRAVRLSEIRAFDRVVVIGAGTMGQLFVMLLKELHAEVFVVDISKYRLEHASKFGAQHTIQSDNNTVESILKFTNGKGADTVILSFLNQEILDLAADCVREGGNICIFAPPIQEHRLEIDYSKFFRRGLRMFSSYSSNLDEIENAMMWISSKKVNVEALITGTVGLDYLLEAVENLTEKDFKVIVQP